MPKLDIFFSNKTGHPWDLDFKESKVFRDSALTFEPRAHYTRLILTNGMTITLEPKSRFNDHGNMLALCFRDPNTSTRFGIKIHQKAIWGGFLGYRPTWAYMIDGGRPAFSAPNWSSDFKDPTLNFQCNGGAYYFDAKPECGDNALSVHVLIGNR